MMHRLEDVARNFFLNQEAFLEFASSSKLVDEGMVSTWNVESLVAEYKITRGLELCQKEYEEVFERVRKARSI